MPSVSDKQHRFMEAIKHSPSFAKKAGVPQSVGRDFAKADDAAGITKSHSYAEGGFVSMGHSPVPTMGVSSAQPAPPMNVPVGNPASRPAVGPRKYGKK